MKSEVKSPIEVARANVMNLRKSLKEPKRTAQAIQTKLLKAETHLVELTGAAFVVVVGGEIADHRITRETAMVAHGLTVWLDAFVEGDTSIRVRGDICADADMTINLFIGQETRFTCNRLNIGVTYHVRTFALEEDAKAWATQQRQERAVVRGVES
jgi:hypothetical protein